MKHIGVCLFVLVLNSVCRAQIGDSVLYPMVTITENRIAEAIGSTVTETDSMLYALQRSRGLQHVLENESFITTRAYSPGGVANFSVRGTGSQHTQVVWEGIPVNDPMLGQTDLSTISLGGISAVRVLYGSAGLTNNSGGIGGTIELVSLTDRSKEGFDARLNLYAGSFGTYGVALQLRDRYKRLSGSTSVEYHTAKNNFIFRNLATIQQEEKRLEHAAIERIGFTRSLAAKLNDRNSLKASFYYAQVDRQFPPTMLMVSTEETLFDRDIWAALNWKRVGRRSQLSVTASYIYGKQEYFDNNRYTFEHAYHANKNLIRYKLNMGHGLHLDIGGDVFNETARSDSAYRSEPRWRFWQAAFASLKYVPKKWVAAQALVREDVIDGRFSPVQGLLGVEVKPAKWFFVKGNFARNFRPPTMNDLYWVPGGNPELESETGLSWEAGIGFRHLSQRGGVKWATTYFNSDIDNWIIWLADGNIWRPQNKRSVQVQGVEQQMEASLNVGRILFRVNAYYTWVSSTVSEGASVTDASVGKQLIYVPEHQAKAQLSVHLGKLFLTYGHQYMGIRYTTSDNEHSLPAYQLSFASVGYEFTLNRHALGFSVTIDNLLDTEYQSIAWRPMPGRSFLINLNYQFL